ncbi:UNKNOWN [Stylonychia lemnae]|uniref:Uncharacterized protein n=1 Tax=Stylonychia lemnae TaxID=5949 RepID=A0A078BAL8_STYLE|nr:UNKNOWN [Stylonychia lemnae]|eukprot:CDW90613.1 UNKNOWN [Stylonychia lemnae]
MDVKGAQQDKQVILKCSKDKICLTCKDDNIESCLTCVTGFSQDSSNSCKTCHLNPTLCVKEQCNTECSACYDGFGLFNNYCFKCYDENCLECPGSIDCMTCSQKYTPISKSLVEYEDQKTIQCQDKENTTANFEIYITNKDTAKSVQAISGTISDAFGDLEDALEKAYELSSSYIYSKVTIYLLNQNGTTHYLLNNLRDYYLPRNVDKRHQSWDIIIKPYSKVTEKVVIINKRRDKLKFLVGQGLEIQDIVIDSLDSVISRHNDPANCLSSKIICCQNDGGKIKSLTSTPCLNPQNQLWKPTRERCLAADGISVFQFGYTGLLPLNFIPILKFKRAGKITIEFTTFQYFSGCGAIIRNFQSKFNFTPEFIDMHQSRSNQIYNYRLNYASQEIKRNYPDENIQTQLNCSIIECHQIKIYGSNFQNFYFMRKQLSNAVFVDPTLGMQFYSSSCSISSEIYNGITNLDDSIYPIFKNRTHPQISNIISILGLKQLIVMRNNTFLNNTSVKGLIYIQNDEDPKNNNAIVLSDNLFKHNGGYFANIAVFIRTFVQVNLYQVNPQEVKSCKGIHVTNNQFELNYGCAKFGGGVFQYECLTNDGVSNDIYQIKRNDSALVRQNNDPLIIESMPQRLIWKSIDYKNFIFNSNLVEIKFLDNSTSNIDMDHFTVKSNRYIQNFASMGKGIVDITGVQILRLINETYQENGENLNELILYFNQLFDVLLIPDEDLTQTVMDIFTTVPELINLDHRASLAIYQCNYLYLDQMTFHNNWLLSVSSMIDLNRAQELAVENFYGTFVIQNSVFSNLVDGVKDGSIVSVISFSDQNQSFIKDLIIQNVTFKDMNFGFNSVFQINLEPTVLVAKDILIGNNLNISNVKGGKGTIFKLQRIHQTTNNQQQEFNILFRNSIIQNISTNGNGSILYIDSNGLGQSLILMKSLVGSNILASGSGSIIYGQSLNDQIQILQNVKLGQNNLQNIDANQTGKGFYIKQFGDISFEIESSTTTCTAYSYVKLIDDSDNVETIVSQVTELIEKIKSTNSYEGSLIYLESKSNAAYIANSHNIEQCGIGFRGSSLIYKPLFIYAYGQYGGAFFLKYTTPTDDTISLSFIEYQIGLVYVKIKGGIVAIEADDSQNFNIIIKDSFIEKLNAGVMTYDLDRFNKSGGGFLHYIGGNIDVYAINCVFQRISSQENGNGGILNIYSSGYTSLYINDYLSGTQGGAIYCESCVIKMKGSEIFQTFSYQGGFIFVVSAISLRAEDLIVQSTVVNDAGGFLYFMQELTDNAQGNISFYNV